MTEDEITWSSKNKHPIGGWHVRARGLVRKSRICSDDVVLDIGCGPYHTLQQFLPEGCEYIGADLVKHSDCDLLLNFNTDQFPNIDLLKKKPTVVTMSGVFEYVDPKHFQTFFTWLRSLNCVVCVAYCCRNGSDAIDVPKTKTSHGLWGNHFSLPVFVELWQKNGFEHRLLQPGSFFHEFTAKKDK